MVWKNVSIDSNALHEESTNRTRMFLRRAQEEDEKEVKTSKDLFYSFMCLLCKIPNPQHPQTMTSYIVRYHQKSLSCLNLQDGKMFLPCE